MAVLPPDNQSIDLAAPDTFRRVMACVLVSLGYLPMVSPAQDMALQNIGIQDGGQLKAYKSTDIAAKLGVDGLVYGNVEEFNDLNIGVYRSRKVRASVYLASAQGEKYWEVWGRTANSKIGMTREPTPLFVEALAAAGSLVGGLAQTWREKILNIHLLEEASQVGMLMREKIPDWPEPDQTKINTIKKDLHK